LAKGDARIDRYYYCPHLEDGPEGPFRQRCACRKPRPGMIEAATRDLDLDLSRSAMVGDRWLDVVCGRAAGVRALLVRSGHGHREADAPGPGVEADGGRDDCLANWQRDSLMLVLFCTCCCCTGWPRDR